MSVQLNTEGTVLVVLGILAIYNLANYYLIGPFTNFLLRKYKNEAAALENSDNINKDFIQKSGLSEERSMMEILIQRHQKSFDLHLLISNVEFILLAGTTVLVLKDFDSKLNYASLSKIAIVTFAWLIIKILGNYGQWRKPIFGRSIFSVFLLSSITSISLGFIAGLLLAGLV